MRSAQRPFPRPLAFAQRAILGIAALLLVPVCTAQTAPAEQPSQQAWVKELSNYPGLIDEFDRLVIKVQTNVQMPGVRMQSGLLPVLPDATLAYAAFPNYGEAVHQTLEVFRHERAESAVLRDWWQHSSVASAGPKVEDALEKYYQFSQFVGEEMAVSGMWDGKEPRLLMIAQIKKPGLKEFLQQVVAEFSGKSKPGVSILDPKELAATLDGRFAGQALALVRPDYLVAASDVAALRAFNERLDHRGTGFDQGPFGQRILQSYRDGVTVVAALDLQTILSKIPFDSAATRQTFQRSGFADMKYAVWEHTQVAGRGSVSRSELSFVGPRHGAASWLAAPGPLGSLDLVSSRPLLALSLLLKSPAQIFDDVKEIAGPAGPKMFAQLAQWEQGLNLSLREDLLGLLGGEVTLELDKVAPPPAEWRVILRVNDTEHLQRTLDTLLSKFPFPVERAEEDGVTYRTLRIPSGETASTYTYAFVDGYLVAAASRTTIQEAVRLHRRGESLGRSPALLATVAPGHSSDASALFYQDQRAMSAFQLQRVSPEMADLLARSSGEQTALTSRVYGEESAILTESNSLAMDAAPVLVVAAIAIPNLLRSRMAANEASAVGSLRTMNTACVTYASTYGTGFPSKLSYLGTSGEASATSAGLIDNQLAAGVKSGYNFTFTPGAATNGITPSYTIQANPVTPGQTGQRYFFTDQSGVIRMNISRPATSSAPPLN